METGTPVDFYTTHAYPTMYGEHRCASIQDQMVQLRMARSNAGAGADTQGSKPLLITEWSSTPSSRDGGMHDSWQMAAFALAAVLNATDTEGIDLKAYSFWAFSDIFTEGGL